MRSGVGGGEQGLGEHSARPLVPNLLEPNLLELNLLELNLLELNLLAYSPTYPLTY